MRYRRGKIACNSQSNRKLPALSGAEGGHFQAVRLDGREEQVSREDGHRNSPIRPAVRVTSLILASIATNDDPTAWSCVRRIYNGRGVPGAPQIHG